LSPVSVARVCVAASRLMALLRRVLEGSLRTLAGRGIACTVFLLVMHMIAAALLVVMAAAFVQSPGMGKGAR
jgi:hypothetical protein